ncbi:MAG: carboxypeptidase-like regulatory domain-containing protein [Myxococcales bacterium]|nr:carboxypeptidase-like regulatory domain-containing protein [Myxococcales bacterium]
MRIFVRLFLSVGLTLSLVGCGDSESGGSGGTAGSGGSGGAGGSGGSSMVTVTGTVSAAALDGNSTPVEGATVSVVGTSNTATTDAGGNFSVMAPTGTVMFLNTAAGNWGSLFAENVPAGGLAGLDVEVIPDALVDAISDALVTTADTSRGLVAVTFDETTTVGGETASISAASETSFVFDDLDEPVEGDTLVAGGGSEVIFFNVDLAGSVSATATSSAFQPCPLEFPSATYTVQAKVLTEIDVFCPAP